MTDLPAATDAPGSIEQPARRSGTSPSTVWIWLISLLPVVALAIEQPVLLALGPVVSGLVRLQRELVSDPGAAPAVPDFSTVGVLLVADWALSFLVIGLAALAAYLDQRALQRRGVVRPFPWGWGFLPGVYVIGRAVVARRRTGRGLAPLVLAAVLLVLGMVAQLAEFFGILAAAGAFAAH